MPKHADMWWEATLTMAGDQAAGTRWVDGMLQAQAQPLRCDGCRAWLTATERAVVDDPHVYYVTCDRCQRSV